MGDMNEMEYGDMSPDVMTPDDIPIFEEEKAKPRSATIVDSIAHTLSVSVRQLRKTLGFIQGFSLIVGILIGSGVFISPSLVMRETNNAAIALGVWLSCGLIALGGSLCYCELGCAIKKAGGNYAYIYEAYGDFPAFLCSWTIAFIVDPAGLAAITLTLGTYLMKPFDNLIEPNPWYPKALAFLCIIIIAFINSWSLKAATRTQTIFTFAQVLAVAFMAVIGIYKLGQGHTENLKNMFEVKSFSLDDVPMLGAALYNGLWAYDGWALVSNVTEEMKDLNRNLFLSVITGIPFVICCYFLVNVSFLTAMSVKEIGASDTIAVTFIQQTLGEKVAYVMPVLVALSCYGAANGTVFACGRLTLAAGRQGHVPEVLSMIHRNKHTPIPAVILTSIIATLMLIPDASGLETLIGFFNFSCWFIYGISLFAVVILRYRKPDLPRPYKVWIITPILMTLISLFLIVIPFIQNPVNPAIALGMISMGAPFYLLFVHFEPKHPQFFQKFRATFTRFVRKGMNLAPCE